MRSEPYCWESVVFARVRKHIFLQIVFLSYKKMHHWGKFRSARPLIQWMNLGIGWCILVFSTVQTLTGSLTFIKRWNATDCYLTPVKHAVMVLLALVELVPQRALKPCKGTNWGPSTHTTLSTQWSLNTCNTDCYSKLRIGTNVFPSVSLTRFGTCTKKSVQALNINGTHGGKMKLLHVVLRIHK